MKTIFFLLLATTAPICAQVPNNESELVKLSEPYELANIILALTPYGQTDPWEVEQSSAYYREVREYFRPFLDHPLLKKVNYSREEWAPYLSFRTDAYAFQFDDNGVLKRAFPFYANDGISPFDDNLQLIQEFVAKSGFRKFYHDHRHYYKDLTEQYLKSQYYDEMLAFLTREFGKQTEATYAIAMSPLVGRMNCHRTVNNVSTDFITVPGFLLQDVKREATEEEIASAIHMLFTELDHGFVNPVTDKNERLVNECFSVPLWNNKSGYEEDSLAVFNEYMTWAVYDVFVRERFPDVAQKVSADWMLQNETRGFIASGLFNEELVKIYEKRNNGETLRDLYPVFLKRLKRIQNGITTPSIIQCDLAGKTVSNPKVELVLRFSERMTELKLIDVAVKTKDGEKTITRKVLLSGDQVQWTDKGTMLKLKLELSTGKTNKIQFNAPWTTETVIRSRKGINLSPYTSISVSVEP